jgi:hypothetical protein
MILDGSNGVTFNDASLQGAAASPFGLKNRIINGAMVIDQRNAGASVTPTNLQYTIDRWAANLSQASKFTIQQNAGSVTPPAGFNNYLGITSSSAYSVLAGDYFGIYQVIEGFNTSDLDFGKSTAKTITLSFWVRSSLTGTFGGSLMNSGQTRSYPFSYTISVANTWEQKSITIAGDTTGTWVGATNGIGITVQFNLGTGTTYSGTAGAWAGTTYVAPTGATSVVGTNGATFYITGVQLEVGSTATPFERRLYGQELVNCERYCQFNRGSIIKMYTTTQGSSYVALATAMRTSPTGTLYSGTNGILDAGSAFRNIASFDAVEQPNEFGGTCNITSAFTLTNAASYIIVPKRILYTAEL